MARGTLATYRARPYVVVGTPHFLMVPNFLPWQEAIGLGLAPATSLTDLARDIPVYRVKRCCRGQVGLRSMALCEAAIDVTACSSEVLCYGLWTTLDA